MLPTHSSLTAEQMTEIFHQVAECQELGTQLAKQFQTLQFQATAHETNTGHAGRGTAYSILMNGSDSDKKPCKNFMRKLTRLKKTPTMWF